jgi:hypothetical protein
MSRWHDDEHTADQESKTPSPADVLEQRLKRLEREAEAQRQLEEKGSRRRDKGDGR